MMKFEIYKDKGGKYRWRITGSNNEIIGASSQGFTRRSVANLNALLVMKALRYEFSA